jgi:hypothetical protein
LDTPPPPPLPSRVVRPHFELFAYWLALHSSETSATSVLGCAFWIHFFISPRVTATRSSGGPTRRRAPAWAKAALLTFPRTFHFLVLPLSHLCISVLPSTSASNMEVSSVQLAFSFDVLVARAKCLIEFLSLGRGRNRRIRDRPPRRLAAAPRHRARGPMHENMNLNKELFGGKTQRRGRSFRRRLRDSSSHVPTKLVRLRCPRFRVAMALQTSVVVPTETVLVLAGLA